ncbi:glycoside hydrolase family 5 protein [Dermatobacter hominis]|uniref:glycoside hydrolase family 5 protein n=1 Tax=Dermatobacter hominis TaxID=2884263 RepID=UPI001D117163|nr:cellulase family glycosylhydrolase [Dermatobacter hominis]UDY34775.1 glycoside hydrolase family 5 protein [Dermatobacter hominis]
MFAPPSRRSPRPAVAGALLALLAASSVLVACSGGADDDASPTTSEALPSTGALVELRPLHVAEQRIVDDRGRQVLLRGANVNALGEYAQADADTEPTAPVTDEDWDAMAANGFSVVRLIMSWSRLEPERGTVDQDYVAEVREAVEAANDRGIYVVLDVHQDAWGMASATPEGTACPAGTEPSIGWDGAPEWATITDGATTCRAPGSERESAPAVQAAFANLYANTDGIADRLTEVWATIAEEFADVPGVAGYDLINEPNAVAPQEQNQVAYSQWIQRTIDAIRAAEAGAGERAAPKPVFAEPLQLYPLPYNALLSQYIQDPNLVFAPHNYAESINDILTVEQTFAIDQQGADDLHAALWIGEYGFWDTSAETLEVATRYAAEEDRRVVGGTWWQWRQTCGDPHSVGGPGVPATADQVHLITRDCTADDGGFDTDLRATTEFLRILGRAFPRAAPGHISSLASQPGSGGLTVQGAGAEAGGQLVVWLPDVEGAADAQPTTTTGLEDVTMQAVRGGRVLTANATGGDWTLVVV